jgi:branched-subunit amino acid transport protein
MYFSCRWLLTNNEEQLRFSKKGITVVVYLIYITVCLLLSFFTPRGNEQIVSFVCILMFFAFAIASILANPKKTNINYLIFSVVCTMIAFIWFELDTHKILYNANSYFQLHSFWNLFIGLSGFYFYIFIRSEHLGNSGTEEKLK